MANSPDIDFARIATRGGSQDRAFEELTCQLALSDVPDPSRFCRIRGDGGDGGVECLWTSPTGEMHGWQAKYIFDLGRALKKAGASLTTARKNYPALTRYVVCLPFDLSGSKGHDGKSQQDRFDEFKRSAEAAEAGLTVELWSAFRLRDRLLAIDASGGRRRFWFDDAQLGADWFSAQLDTAIVRAGPRYNPKLHHGHVLDETLAALGDTEAWKQGQSVWRGRIHKLAEDWATAVAAKPDTTERFAASALPAGHALLAALTTVGEALARGKLVDALAASHEARAQADECERLLAADIDARYGAGKADSVGFRHFEAEYQCHFPARHLDECRELAPQLAELSRWLDAPAVRANARRVLLLTGPAGIGKTHGLCDAAVSRRSAGLPTVLVSGAQFSSDRTVWECLAAALGLEGSWSRDVLLDALDAAGAISGRLLVCVDALDERARRPRWLDDLPELVDKIAQRPNLALCVAVREGYQRQVVRDGLDLPTFEHPGFGDAVFDACTAFCGHYGLHPPVGPLFEPEFSNPLFLHVLCRTLQSLGLKAVPAGWRGTRRVLGRLLAARDEEVERTHPGIGNRAVSKAMEMLAEAMPEGGSLRWSEADRVVNESLPASQRGRVELLDVLVGLDLLRAIPGDGDGWTDEEDRVDIAFGRLRHHLLAGRLMARSAADEQVLRAALDDPGLGESLALILPERGRGELVDLASRPGERRVLLEAWLAALPWRDGEFLGPRVEPLVIDALRDPDLVHPALDALVTLALRPEQPYDQRYFHSLLSRNPLPRRDSVLCWYLHEAFERASPPSPLVRALRAPWEIDLRGVARALREAWCVVLSWCGAAADLRVRDEAAKALVRLTEVDPGVWPDVVARFAGVDDDTVLERVLFAAYGAVLLNPEPTALADLAFAVRDHVLHRPSGSPLHALVRGHARCIGEWAAQRGVLPDGVTLADFRPPHATAIKLVAPTAAKLKRYDDSSRYPQLYASVMSEWTGDFAKYTMPHVLGDYEALIGEEAARRWVLATVMELGYQPELHAPYDHEMLRVHGPGRGRTYWAERIGKKYQRIALARLLGALDDLAHAKGKPDPGLVCENLRDLDPSLIKRHTRDDEDPAPETCWWVPIAMDFASTASLSDEEWVAADDFPDPVEMVGGLVDPNCPEQRWRLLEGRFSWNDRGGDRERKRYRDAWMMIRGYLVPRRKLAACFKAFEAADFFGDWMIKGFEHEEGIFIGEYPWAPYFPEMRKPAEAWREDGRRFAKFDLRPAMNWVSGVMLPAADLVGATATRWDGVRGFRTEEGGLVFQDPSVPSGGPHGLFVDDAVLPGLQDRLDVAVLWTVLAERRIIGDWGEKEFRGMKHVSMAMWLDGAKVRKRQCRGEHLLSDRTRIRT